MKKRLLLSLLLVGMLTSCGGESDSSISVQTSENPSISVISSALTNDITAIEVANSSSGNYSVKGVVVGLANDSFIIKDTSGVIMVDTGVHSPTVAIGDYVKVQGETIGKYANFQFNPSAAITILEEDAPEINEEPVPLTTDFWNNYDGKIGSLVSGTVLQHDNEGIMYFKYEDCVLLGEFSYLDGCFGVLPENSGRFADFVGYMIQTSGSPQKHNILLTSLTIRDVAPTSVEIQTPLTNIIEVGATLSLKFSVNPSESPQNIMWSSNDGDIATIDGFGVVRGISVGTTKITLKSAIVTALIDEIEITVIVPVAKNYSIEASYDFSNIKDGSSTEINKEVILEAFNTNLVDGNQVVESVESTKVFGANDGQGPKVGGIKFGTASIPGALVLKLTEGTYIARVELVAYNWNASNTTNTVSVNFSEVQIPSVEGSNLIFNVTITDEIRIEFTNRGVIEKIILYTIED